MIESDASSAHTTTTQRQASSTKSTEQAIHEARKKDSDVLNEPVDYDTAKSIMSDTKPEPISPSVGATSMIEPEHIIENPFAEPEDKENLDKKLANKTRSLPMSTLSSYTAKHRVAAEKADRINDSEYDLILARMVAQNRRLNQDPKAIRRSALGMGKLRESFERLQQRTRARNQTEAEGVGSRSKEFGLLPDNQNAPTDETEVDEADRIDWEFWGGLIKSSYSLVC